MFNFSDLISKGFACKLYLLYFYCKKNFVKISVTFSKKLINVAHQYLVFGRSRFQISSQTPIILTKDFRDFLFRDSNVN